MNHRLHHHRHALAALFMLSIIVAGSALGQVSVSLPNLSVLPGATVRIPVNVNSVTGQNVTSYGFIISCDSTILRLTGVDISGSLSDGWSVVSNNFAGAYNAGRMNVQAATAVPAVGSGGLIYITGTAQNKAGSTILQLTSFIFNTGTPTQTITNGSVRVNRAPSIAAIADKNAAQAVLLTFTASATDPDLPNDTLTYTMSNAPQGATLVPSTGVFSWTPTYAQVGLYTVTIKVTDTGGASDSTVVRITVAKTNVKPSFTKRLPDTTIAESKTMSYT